MSEQTIKAIETSYQGYRFRSRLEARWAVFFDSLLSRWEYEKEGFDLGSLGWYLPDFFLSNSSWVEIKPAMTRLDFTKESERTDPAKITQLNNLRITRDKCAMLAFQSRQPVALVEGNPWPDEYSVTLFAHDFPFLAILGSDYCFGSGGRLMKQSVVEVDDELMSAYKAARSARFEHGENPAKDVFKKTSDVLFIVEGKANTDAIKSLGYDAINVCEKGQMSDLPIWIKEVAKKYNHKIVWADKGGIANAAAFPIGAALMQTDKDNDASFRASVGRLSKLIEIMIDKLRKTA